MAHEPLVPVVDDYADARAMYAAWLRVSGYRVAQAGTVTCVVLVLSALITRAGRHSPVEPA